MPNSRKQASNPASNSDSSDVISSPPDGSDKPVLKHKTGKRSTIAIIYACMALVMLPWAFSLAQELPKRHLVNHWRLVWFGYDIIMGIIFLITAYGLYKRRYWLPISASVAATLVFCDAWFDIGTADTSKQMFSAIILAVVIEIPIGIMSLWIAHTALTQKSSST